MQCNWRASARQLCRSNRGVKTMISMRNALIVIALVAVAALLKDGVDVPPTSGS